MAKILLFATITAAVTFPAAASAAPPLKHIVWAKTVAAYKTQALAHRAPADCTPWSPTGVTAMSCDFGVHGRVVLSWRPEPCVYRVLVETPRSPGSSFMRSEQADMNYCGARWWTRPLPAPWSQPDA